MKNYRQDQEIVLFTDDRKQVKDTSLPPFRWICSIEVEFEEPVFNPLAILESPGLNWRDVPTGTSGCGSGLLIDDRRVLTCSHVLMGLRLRRSSSGKEYLVPVMPGKVTVTPARNEARVFGAKPFGQWKAEAVLINPRFREMTTGLTQNITREQLRPALQHDFALVELAKRYDPALFRKTYPGEKIGWWKSASGSYLQPVDGDFRRRLERRKINVCGYPGEKGHIPCGLPYIAFDDVVTAFPTAGGATQDLLLYRADTSAGMSGSPVWIKNDDGKRFLVAVHSSFQEYFPDNSEDRATANLGVLATSKMLQQLKQWGAAI